MSISTNIRKLFNPAPSPRILLIFPSIVVMLLSMLLSGLAFTYSSGLLALAGMFLAVMWLGILVLIALPQTDMRLAGIRRWLKPVSSVIMVALLIAGVVEAGVLLATNLETNGGSILGSATPKFLKSIPGDIAYSDSDAVLYQAVHNLEQGKNPYAEINVVLAILDLRSPPGKITPLRAGSLADVFPYPSQAQYADIWQQALQAPGMVSPEIESNLGYPAGFFIIPALFMWLGIDNLRWIMLLLVLPAVVYVIARARPDLRLWLAGAFLGSLVIWNGIASGMTGTLYFPFLLLAWVLWRRNLWLSALFMGIAVATKQVAWFFLPFYLVLIWRSMSLKQAAGALTLAGGVFLAFNAHFILNDPELWLNSMLSLVRDHLFPFGTGPVTLVTYGILHIESSLVFLALEAAAMLGGLMWFWFKAKRCPAMGIILSALPIFFSWRSMWPYFFYIDVILLATVVINDYDTAKIVSPEKITLAEG